MSGTAFGAIVLHVAPEAADGGPLALVQNGDRISLDVAARKIELLVDDAELARRKAQWTTPVHTPMSGYRKLYVEHVTQAPLGCDFDFMLPAMTQSAPLPPV